MMGPGFGTGIATLAALGVAFAIILMVFLPPAAVAGLAWLIGPRFGFDVDVLAWFGWGLLAWVPSLLGLIWWGR